MFLKHSARTHTHTQVVLDKAWKVHVWARTHTQTHTLSAVNQTDFQKKCDVWLIRCSTMMGALRWWFSECSGPAREPQLETPRGETRSCTGKKIHKRVTVLWRGREVLGTERCETERLETWRDSEGSQTPDGRKYGFSANNCFDRPVIVRTEVKYKLSNPSTKGHLMRVSLNGRMWAGGRNVAGKGPGLCHSYSEQVGHSSNGTASCSVPSQWQIPRFPSPSNWFPWHKPAIHLNAEAYRTIPLLSNCY